MFLVSVTLRNAYNITKYRCLRLLLTLFWIDFFFFFSPNQVWSIETERRWNSRRLPVGRGSTEPLYLRGLEYIRRYVKVTIYSEMYHCRLCGTKPQPQYKHNLIVIPPAYEVCGKAMFLLCVSVHMEGGGGTCPVPGPVSGPIGGGGTLVPGLGGGHSTLHIRVIWKGLDVFETYCQSF